MTPRKRRRVLFAALGAAVLVLVCDMLMRGGPAAASAASPAVASTNAGGTASPPQVAPALERLAEAARGVDPDRLGRLFGIGGELPTAAPASQPTPSSPDVPATPLVLTAVSSAGGGGAVINGTMIRVGERRAGLLLIRVSGRTALVRRGDRTLLLEMEGM